MNAEDKAQLYEYAEAAKGKGLNKIYLHWTAGSYTSVFKDYHINVMGDGVVYFTTEDLTKVLSHTWHRNTNAIGISLCCLGGYAVNANNGYDAEFGEYPPTTEQIESMAQCVAVLCEVLGIPLDKSHVMTHTEVAYLDGYGPGSGDAETKWDLWYLPDYDGVMKPGGDVIRGKAAWYKEHGF